MAPALKSRLALPPGRPASESTSVAVPPQGLPQSTVQAESATGGESLRPVWFGFETRRGARGLIVERVYRESPAHRAGLSVGDQLQTLNGRSVFTLAELAHLEARLRPGESASLGVLRGGTQRLLRLDGTSKPEPEALLKAHYIGQRAPSLSSLVTIQGTVVPSLEHLRGKVVVLEFWASWCVACQSLTPTLNAWASEREALGVRVIGVTMDPFEQAALDAATLGVTYTLCADTDGAVTAAYSGYALPLVLVIDQRGQIRDLMMGYDTKNLAALDATIERLLAE